MTPNDWLRLLDVVVIAVGLSVLVVVGQALVETLRRWRDE